MEFIDSDGSMIVPKSVRPIIDMSESFLGAKKGSVRQYRRGKLHVREYEDRYTIHIDRISPEVSPLGHLLLDAPEYAIGAYVALAIGKNIGSSAYKLHKQMGSDNLQATIGAVAAGCLAGALSGSLAHLAINRLKKGCG